jgi:hypothetical protein
MPQLPTPRWNSYAVAVAARTDRLRVASTNETGGFLNSYRSQRWPPEEPAGPYAVHLAGQGGFRTLFLDLDCDDPPTAAAQVSDLSALLTQAGIRFVEVRSGPSARTHLVATWQTRLPPAAVQRVGRALRQHAPDLDITPLCNPATGSMRPPGSPHRSGGRSRVIGGQREALEVLQVGNDQRAWTRLCALLRVDDHDDGASFSVAADPRLAALPQAGGLPRLDVARRGPSRETAGLIVNGDTLNRFGGNRSAVAVAITASIIQIGWSFPEFLAVALDPSSVGLAHLRMQHSGGGRLLPRRDPEGAARRMWLSTIQWVLDHPATPLAPRDIPLQLPAVATAVDAAGWGGQAGPGERAVMDALLVLALAVGSVTVGCSVRRLAILVGLSKTTAAAVLIRLQTKCWLVALPGRKEREAATFELSVPMPPGAVTGPGGPMQHGASTEVEAVAAALVVGRTLDLAPPGNSRTASEFVLDLRPGASLRPALPHVLGLASRRHDAMSQGSDSRLGRTAGYLADLLKDAASDQATLTTRSGLRLRTVRRHLRHLRAAGVVICAQRMWSLVRESDAALDRAAHERGATGVVARRDAEYRTESATYAWLLADHASARGFTSARGLRRPGHAAISGAAVVSPRCNFPRDADGRTGWRTALGMTRVGLGLQTDELATLNLDGELIHEPHRERPAAAPRRTRSRPGGAATTRPRRRTGAVPAPGSPATPRSPSNSTRRHRRTDTPGTPRSLAQHGAPTSGQTAVSTAQERLFG